MGCELWLQAILTQEWQGRAGYCRNQQREIGKRWPLGTPANPGYQAGEPGEDEP